MNIPTHPDMKPNEVVVGVHRNPIFFEFLRLPANQKRQLNGAHVAPGRVLSDWYIIVTDRETASTAGIKVLTDWPDAKEFKDALHHNRLESLRPTPIPKTPTPTAQVPVIPVQTGNGTKPKSVVAEDPAPSPAQQEAILGVHKRKPYAPRKPKIVEEKHDQPESVKRHTRRAWNPKAPSSEVVVHIRRDYNMRDILQPHDRECDEHYEAGAYRMQLTTCREIKTERFPDGVPWYRIVGSHYGLPCALMQVLVFMGKDKSGVEIDESS